MSGNIWIKIIPYVICLLLGMFVWKSCDEISHLKEQNKQIKRLNNDLVEQVKQIESENQLLLNDVADYEGEISKPIKQGQKPQKFNRRKD